MRKKLPLLPTIVLPIWVLSLLFSLSLYAQPSKEYGSKTVAALKQSGMAASSVSGSLRNMIILPSPHSI
jgi:hypothetical protein